MFMSLHKAPFLSFDASQPPLLLMTSDIRLSKQATLRWQSRILQYILTLSQLPDSRSKLSYCKRTKDLALGDGEGNG